MRRKDGKGKRKARRTMPVFNGGFHVNSCLEHLHPLANSETPKLTVASMFAGCGGLDLGLEGGFEYLGQKFGKLPVDVIAAYDNSKDAVETYNLNFGKDIAKEVDLINVDVNDLPYADILTGGFPCQDFSSSGPKKGFEGKRGKHYLAMVEYMKIHQPKIVIGENVRYLARLNKGKYLEKVISDFEAQGYHFTVWDLYGPDYGLSQSRRRLFLIGVRNDIFGYPVKPEAKYKNNILPIERAIEDLVEIEDETVTNQSQYFVATRATSGGGQGDHTNKRGEVAYCIRANSRGRIQFHYELDRRLTVRECARLQSFPDEFVFPYSTQRNLTLIGNAVPPILGHQVGASIVSFIQKQVGAVNPNNTCSVMVHDKQLELL